MFRSADSLSPMGMGINRGRRWHEARLQYAGHALTTNDVPDPWIGLEIPRKSGRNWNGIKQEMHPCRAR
jgi:hypothetical protein